MSLFGREDKVSAARMLLGLPAFLLLSVGIAAREAIRVRNKRRMQAGLRQFTPLPGLATYQVSQPRLSPAFARVPHAVLLLHGYSASPQEFVHLMHALDRAGIPYYAPVLTGHGLDDFRLLYRVAAADWLRDAVTAYDLLAALAEKVSVVGHSTGGTLGVYLAEHRPVHHVILSAPNLFPNAADLRARRLMRTPVLSSLVMALRPVFAKPVRPGRTISSDTLDEAAARRGFSYATLPTHSLREQWALQDRIDLARARWHRLTLVYGEQDHTVDMQALRTALDQRGIQYTVYSFANSAHNVLIDYEKDAVVRAIVDTLCS